MTVCACACMVTRQQGALLVGPHPHPHACAGPAGSRPCYIGCTLAFAAPEMIRGMLGGTASAEPIDGIAEDLWGVGCLMYEMLTSDRLFGASGTSEVEAAIIRDMHDELVFSRPCCPLYLLSCIMH